MAQPISFISIGNANYLTGASGVKMTGPYDFVPPNYWLTDTQAGGAYGFNTETSPGPVIPPLESLKRFLPADHLWPMNDFWAYHSGGSDSPTSTSSPMDLINAMESPPT